MAMLSKASLPVPECSQRSRAVNPRFQRVYTQPSTVHAVRRASAGPGASLPAAVVAATAGGLVLGHRASRRQRRARQAVQAAVPEGAEFLHHVQQWLQHAAPGAGMEDLAAALHQWAQTASELPGRAAHDFWPPAFAEELVLDPNTTYLKAPDGSILVDPMNNKPIPDDWWNGFIGFQSDIIKDWDARLRAAGVEQAFGWTIVAYTVFIKVLFYPLQQGQLRSSTMMQMLSPKVKEITEKYKDDPDTQQRLLAQLYGAMDVNPLGGCLPVFLQLPIFWSLYGVWRRLAAENFQYFKEGWLWVPSLAQPNPDFQFKYDWLLEFQNGQPTMGWHDYLCYLVFPAVLVGFTVISQQQAQSGRPKDAVQDESQQLILQVLPWISVYFIGSLSLQLPQAVSVYYAVNTALSVAQTQLVKNGLRGEIAGYEEFEKTGKFPEGSFEDMVRASAPEAKTLHEAALRGDVRTCEKMLDEEGKVSDINGWDEKNISPVGYAVACGHVDTVRLLLERGADVSVKDGQGNTLLHYAAGYGHLEVLKILLESGKGVWTDDDLKEFKNSKGQSVIDAARVNRKGQIVDFLCDRLGLDAEVVKLTQPSAASAAPATQTEAKPAAESAESPETARARAALLAAAGGEAPAAAASAAAPPVAAAPAAPAAPGGAADASSAMAAAVQKLKANPEAMEQARQMMGKVPPQMLQMLSGNKLSAEQAQKAMDTMSKMSTEEILEKADMASQQMAKVSAANQKVEPAAPGSKPARSVD